MANTSNSGASTAKNSEENSERLALLDLKSYQLGETGHNARTCSFEEFVAFARSLVQLEDTGDVRTVFDRRDFLNWCLDQGILRIEGAKLVIVEQET